MGSSTKLQIVHLLIFILTNRFEKIDIERVSSVLKATVEFNGKTTEKESAPS